MLGSVVVQVVGASEEQRRLCLSFFVVFSFFASATVDDHGVSAG